MTNRLVLRLKDIDEAIRQIDMMVTGLSPDIVQDNPVLVAAFERFIEIISEASRSIPDDLKMKHGAEVPWRQVAGVGNILRHAYQNRDFAILWNIYLVDLPVLRAAVSAMRLALEAE